MQQINKHKTENHEKFVWYDGEDYSPSNTKCLGPVCLHRINRNSRSKFYQRIIKEEGGEAAKDMRREMKDKSQ